MLNVYRIVMDREGRVRVTECERDESISATGEGRVLLRADYHCYDELIESEYLVAARAAAVALEIVSDDIGCDYVGRKVWPV